MQRNKTLLQISIKSKIKFTMQLGRAIIELLVSLFFSEVRKKSKTQKNGSLTKTTRLSETAAFIYEQTGDAVSAKEIAKRLGKAYDMPAEEVQEDVNAVLETFRNYGILERV